MLNRPEGFDYSSILIDQGQYYNPDCVANGEKKREHGYATNVTMDKAINWLSGRDQEKPFCLMVHNKAPQLVARYHVYNEPEYTSVKDSLIRQLHLLQTQYGDSDSLAEKILDHDKTMMGRFKNAY